MTLFKFDLNLNGVHTTYREIAHFRLEEHPKGTTPQLLYQDLRRLSTTRTKVQYRFFVADVPVSFWRGEKVARRPD